ncbi:cytochrome P450 [Deinococcus maricopensis]|uniref:Cytochrome P450 n=1 Tax=Deinococcus maricopensis (strain DSM 21211 / LMG 22137 / NRRL B-23946 / LB-34) TaxID=709986 RepID=E8U6X1_DEIML|nr:cytochrome P450 [Deinococcus maricopensis]ADV66810.1 cytochrome P450 [Deinococcus maricopensis DSM 21211]
MTTAPATCPFHSPQKTNFDTPHTGPAVTRDAQGTYHVHGFQEARAVLRSEHVRQAGFHSEDVTDSGALVNPPVLFLEGEAHHDMRRQTAKYFTPVTVGSYRRMMENLADDLVGELVARGQANLDDLSLRMAVQVAARVVGLTDSLLPGMAGRIARFVEAGEPGQPGTLGVRLKAQLNRAELLSFLFLDVKPAIRARRARPQEDVISHVLAKGYSDIEILTECVTYGTAGMVTTREFISVATWHLLENPELRHTYLHSTEQERHALLLELLRLEPVVAQLVRRAVADVPVGDTVIPAGSLIQVHVYDTNLDERTVGDDPQAVCPARPLPRGVPGQGMSFGDGHHRCPGAYIAIQETDIFLRRLLSLRDLRLAARPRVTRNDLIKGYELRGLTLRVGA